VKSGFCPEIYNLSMISVRHTEDTLFN